VVAAVVVAVVAVAAVVTVPLVVAIKAALVTEVVEVLRTKAVEAHAEVDMVDMVDMEVKPVSRSVQAPRILRQLVTPTPPLDPLQVSTSSRRARSLTKTQSKSRTIVSNRRPSKQWTLSFLAALAMALEADPSSSPQTTFV